MPRAQHRLCRRLYLQGEFLDGEVVYCYMPPGYEERDEHGNPYLLRVEKPIYGIPQAGRRLQRKAFPWFLSPGPPTMYFR